MRPLSLCEHYSYTTSYHCVYPDILGKLRQRNCLNKQVDDQSLNNVDRIEYSTGVCCDEGADCVTKKTTFESVIVAVFASSSICPQ